MPYLSNWDCAVWLVDWGPCGLPLVDLVGRSLALVTVPTKDYLFLVVLTPAIVDLFSKTFAPVAAPNRDKGVAS